jgi:hypothetical protein
MIEQRALAGSITSENEVALPRIPECEREHTGESFDKPVTELEVETRDHRDVRCRGDYPPLIRQPPAKGFMVVNLPVADH